MKHLFQATFLLVIVISNSLYADNAKHLFILSGQSNMQGHAQVRTFDHIGMDPKTAPILKAIRNADGTPKVCENVWISSVDTAAPGSERHGRLTAGYGASGRGLKIGPELTFGIYMKQHVDEPILIIKTAWGGKTIDVDFRPPSSAKADPSHPVGPYYLWMLREVADALFKLPVWRQLYQAIAGTRREREGRY